MDRFRIEDIIAQDQNGIVFRALDTSNGELVTIRRFFPFGQNGDGLNEEERAAYAIASKRLTAIRHPSLRSVLFGSTDPVDGMPFLVTEWIDGISLMVPLADGPLDPALVIDLLHQALEVSVVLSHVLGEEAVWVETDPQSIIVGSEESGRGFTFWISPLKWLGGEAESRNLTSIVVLGERLAGWTGKMVSDQAGSGLGGWLKWAKKHPDTSLREALETLAASTGNEPPPPEETLVQQATRPALHKVKARSSKVPVFLTIALVLLVLGAALFYRHKTAVVPRVVEDLPGEGGQPTASAAPQNHRPAPGVPPPAVDAATARVNALAERLSRKAAAQDSTAQKRLSEEREAFKSRGGILAPSDRELIRTLKNNDSFKLRGTLREVRHSNSGKTLYLVFSDESDDTIGGVREAHYSDDLNLEALSALIGKTITLDAKLRVENPTKRHVAMISDRNQIEVAP